MLEVCNDAMEIACLRISTSNARSNMLARPLPLQFCFVDTSPTAPPEIIEFYSLDQYVSEES